MQTHVETFLVVGLFVLFCGMIAYIIRPRDRRRQSALSEHRRRRGDRPNFEA
jgi:hypothetical protein